MNLAFALKTQENLQSFKEKVSQLKLASTGTELDSSSRDEILRKSLGEFYPIIREIFAAKNELTFAKQIQFIYEAIDNIKVLNVALSFVPSTEFINKISAWVSKNVSDNVILKFTLQPEILGGCILSFEGKYLDLSAKKKLLNLFEKNTPVFLR